MADDKVDFGKLNSLLVYDEFGNTIRFSDIYNKQKTIVVFTRHFHCFVCKKYIEDLGIVPPENLQPFKQETRFNYPLYTDPEREGYKALKLVKNFVHGDAKINKHVKQDWLTGTLKSTWDVLRVWKFEGNIMQQGGAFILGPGDVVHFAHIDANSLDHTPINDLLEKAGVAQFSFPNDKRE